MNITIINPVDLRKKNKFKGQVVDSICYCHLRKKYFKGFKKKLGDEEASHIGVMGQ